MNSITFFLSFIPFLALILLSINLIFAPHNSYQEKSSTFECGFHSFLGQNRAQFNISFFVFGLLFLLFDMELVLLFPAALSLEVIDIYGLISMLIFFVILTAGFAFELGKKALNIDSRQNENKLNYEVEHNIYNHFIKRYIVNLIIFIVNESISKLYSIILFIFLIIKEYISKFNIIKLIIGFIILRVITLRLALILYICTIIPSIDAVFTVSSYLILVLIAVLLICSSLKNIPKLIITLILNSIIIGFMFTLLSFCFNVEMFSYTTLIAYMYVISDNIGGDCLTLMDYDTQSAGPSGTDPSGPGPSGGGPNDPDPVVADNEKSSGDKKKSSADKKKSSADKKKSSADKKKSSGDNEKSSGDKRKYSGDKKDESHEKYRKLPRANDKEIKLNKKWIRFVHNWGETKPPGDAASIVTRGELLNCLEKGEEIRTKSSLVIHNAFTEIYKHKWPAENVIDPVFTEIKATLQEDSANAFKYKTDDPTNVAKYKADAIKTKRVLENAIKRLDKWTWEDAEKGRYISELDQLTPLIEPEVIPTLKPRVPYYLPPLKPRVSYYLPPLKPSVLDHLPPLKPSVLDHLPPLRPPVAEAPVTEAPVVVYLSSPMPPLTEAPVVVYLSSPMPPLAEAPVVVYLSSPRPPLAEAANPFDGFAFHEDPRGSPSNSTLAPPNDTPFNPHLRPPFNPHLRPSFNPHLRPPFNPHLRPPFNPHLRSPFNPHLRPPFNPPSSPGGGPLN